jgi:predicted metal-dependent HD superfamily phosphohydrolase
MLDERRWRDLLGRCGGNADATDAYPRLLAAYRRPDRFYHAAAHIGDCLHWLDQSRSTAGRPDEVELALWFHDAVYDPHASDNEERSAAWASDSLEAAGIDRAVRGRVHDLILATKHNAPPTAGDAEVIVDIDLSILGRDPDTFSAYDGAIAKEYAWVPWEQYRAGRTAVLDGFLRRAAIFRTEFFRERFEDRARRNILAAIRMLNGG